MKNFFTCLMSIICSIPVQSQLRSELNLPRVGDVLMKEHIGYFDPGEPGEKQIWDLSRIKLIENTYIVNYFTRDDREIIGAENGKLSFLSTYGDSLLLSGYENPNSLVHYLQPGLLIQFPVKYGSTSKGQFQGRGKHFDRIESIVSGEINTEVDAAGAIILPGNDTLNCVIRIHIRKTEISRYIPVSFGFDIDSPANDSLFLNCEPEMIITDTYQWYEEGFRYPVFETVETYRNDSTGMILLSRDAYFYQPAEQAYLPDDAKNQEARERKATAHNAGILEKDENLLLFNCYPNPVKEHIVTELFFRQPVTVEAGLWDMNGRLIRQFPSKSNVNHYREMLDVKSYPPGYYLIKVVAGGETISEKIVKQ